MAHTETGILFIVAPSSTRLRFLSSSDSQPILSRFRNVEASKCRADQPELPFLDSTGAAVEMTDN
jgi:hypothetical protein